MDVLVSVFIMDGDEEASKSVSGTADDFDGLIDTVIELATDCALALGAIPE